MARRYAVRIGQFNQEKPARKLLSTIKQTIPQAFLWKGDYKKSQIVRRYGPHLTPGEKRTRFRLQPVPANLPLRIGRDQAGNPGHYSGKTSGDGTFTERQICHPGGKNNLPESSLEIRRAILWGTVLESSPLPGNPLGLVPEKEITRVMVRVDKSEAVKGYPNFLQDKETEEIILYSEIRQPFFIPAQKIKALVEYQGDKYKRFFWIKQAEPIKP